MQQSLMRAVGALLIAMSLGPSATWCAAQDRDDLYCSPDAPRLPTTITLPRQLERIVERLLQRSPTFQDQCRRLALAPHFFVRIRMDLAMPLESIRARSVIYRKDRRPILAVVEIGPGGPQYEWIAHEFEHLIEQLDGVELDAPGAWRRGVWRTRPGIFESARAVAAGEAVREELRCYRRSDKIVVSTR